MRQPPLPHGPLDRIWVAPSYEWWALVLTVVLACVVIWLVYRRRRLQTGLKGEQGAKVAHHNPVAQLVAGLEGLQLEDPWEPPQQIAFSIQLSRYLRLGFQLRFGFTAVEMTTDELRSELERRSLLEKERDEILSYLKLADQVKYAGRALPSDEAREFHRRCKIWVQRLLRNLET